MSNMNTHTSTAADIQQGDFITFTYKAFGHTFTTSGTVSSPKVDTVRGKMVFDLYNDQTPHGNNIHGIKLSTPVQIG